MTLTGPGAMSTTVSGSEYVAAYAPDFVELMYRQSVGSLGASSCCCCKAFATSSSSSAASDPLPDFVTDFDSFDFCLPTCFLSKRLIVSVFWLLFVSAFDLVQRQQWAGCLTSSSSFLSLWCLRFRDCSARCMASSASDMRAAAFCFVPGHEHSDRQSGTDMRKGGPVVTHRRRQTFENKAAELSGLLTCRHGLA